MNKDKIKIILDTDIGDDIDDAFALSLALNSNEIDVVAITTVFKNVTLRTQQTIQLLKALNKDIKVYSGEGMPLSNEVPLFPADYKFLDKIKDRTKIIPCQYDKSMECRTNNGAVDKIIELANKYDGELVIVTIGAHTNLAKAILKDNSIVKKIKKVYMMGGEFNKSIPEWNIICDPIASEIVMKSGLDIYAVGCDITFQVDLPNDVLESVKKSTKPVNKLISCWLDRWFDYFKYDKSVLHDPLVIGCLVDNFCEFKQRYVKVITEGELKGSIKFSDTFKESYYKINTAVSVNKDKFIKFFKERIL